MGGVLCKQRSRSRPPLSRRKKLHRVDCLLRAPCLLCFIVHSEQPATEAPSRDLPASQHCAHLLLSACQERHFNGALVTEPGLALCPASGDTMVCKRKNCEDSQQPLTPCKQPRCAPDTEQPHPQHEDLSLRHEDLTEDLSPPNTDLASQHKDLSSHREVLPFCRKDLLSHSSREDLSPRQNNSSHHKGEQSSECHPEEESKEAQPEEESKEAQPEEESKEERSPAAHAEERSPAAHAEERSPAAHAEERSPCCDNPSSKCYHEDQSSLHEDLFFHREGLSLHSEPEDYSSQHEDLLPHHHCKEQLPCSGGGTAHPETEYLLSREPLLCPIGGIQHSISKVLSSYTGEKTVKPEDRSSCFERGAAHLKPEDLSPCPSKDKEHLKPGDQSYSSGGQAHSGCLTRSFIVLVPSSADRRGLNLEGKHHPTGDPAPSLPRSLSQQSIEEQCPPLSADQATKIVEAQKPHCSGVKTLQSRGEGHIPGDSVLGCIREDANQTTRDPAVLRTVLHCKPVNEDPFQLGREDFGLSSGRSNNFSSRSTKCLDHTSSSLASPCNVEFPAPGCNQTSPTQSPIVEGEGLGPCEPLHINQLPPSLLLKIFSLLSLNERCLSASLVCKYWRELCLDFQFWKQLDLSSRQQVKDNLLEKIASRCLNIAEINISDCLNVTDAGICKLATICSSLVKYTAYRCKQLSDPSLISLATHCPSLQKVHVGNQDRLTDKALHQLGSSCKDLRDIHFGQCYKISDEGMVVIAKGCPKLQKIYMQENKLVTNRSVEAFAEYCPELQYVGFMGCSVTSQGVIHLTKLKYLSSLDLRNITELDNQTVVEIVKKCQNLTSLNLCLNRNIDDRCVEVIAKEGRSLKELYLVTCKITDHALIAIGRYSSTIETVDVGWCKEITDQGATLIAQSSKSIRYLGLMRCDQVNETTVEQLVQQYPHITFSTVLQDCKRTLERAYQMGWTPNASTVS